MGKWAIGLGINDGIKEIEKIMVKRKSLFATQIHIPVFKKTSIGRNPSLAMMNKNNRRNFSRYKAQGK